MENDRILFYDAISLYKIEIEYRSWFSYGHLNFDDRFGGLNLILPYDSISYSLWSIATTYTRDAIYIDFMSCIQYGFNRYGNSMNWTGSIKGFYYQHTGIILFEDTYEGATI